MSEKQNMVVGTFDIPDELAKKLSELLTRQTIRERVLVQVINEPDKYAKAEEMLMPIVSEVEAIKAKITKEFVPEEFNSIEFMWNYDGYEIAKNVVQIIRVNQ